MKYLISVLCLCCSLSFAEQKLQIALVDLQSALERVEMGKNAKASLEKEVNQKKAQIEKQQNELRKEMEQFEKKAAIMNESARATKQAELQKRLVDFQKQTQETQIDLQKKERDLTKPIIDKLRSLIEAVGKEKQYHLVLEKSAGGVLYAENATDITESIIEKFNSAHSGKAKK